MSLKYSFFLSICLYLFLLLYQFNFFLAFIFISILVILKTKDFKMLVSSTKTLKELQQEAEAMKLSENQAD